jgi:CubicO group peptidase (beta-lactamase class C family)
MTKPITTLAVLMLVADGKVKLEDSLGSHLPEWKQPSVFVGDVDGALKVRPVERAPTVRHLLSHQLGVAYLSPYPHPVIKRYAELGIDHGSGEVILPGDGSKPVGSAEELSRRLASIPLLHDPGARWTYGSSTDLAGALVERISGQRLGDFLQSRLFVPLGMKDTFFRVPDAWQSRFTPAYVAKTQRPSGVVGFNPGRVDDLGPSELMRRDGVDASSPFRRERPIHFGGAGLVSTAADYQRFLTLLLQDGRWQGAQLVPAELVREMRKDALSAEASNKASLWAARGLGFGLGLGLVLRGEPSGLPEGLAFWGGAASTYAWLQPREGITAVLMTQVFGGDVAPYQTLLAKALMPEASRSGAIANAGDSFRETP